MTSVNDLLQHAAARGVHLDEDMLQLVYDFMCEAHAGQKRLSGEAYVTHPLATAETLIRLGLDEATIFAGLLHDVPEDTHVTSEELERQFGPEIAALVNGVTKLGAVRYRGVERYQENLRRMIIAMAQDIRVIFIKFADRLHNLQTLGALPPEKRKRIALESLEIYAPIANRLGMGDLKGAIEDAAFPHAYPKQYEALVKRVDEPMRERHAYLASVRERIEQELRADGIDVDFVDGRAKHLYSLHRKLLAHDDDLTTIYDLVALRVVVKNLSDCYAAIGTIHKLWTPLKGRIKDYVAQPKPNGYQSLHTTVFCDDGKIVEFQVRTRTMHDSAEHGVAAHWRYDENGKQSTVDRGEQFAWVQELLARQHDYPDRDQYLESLKLDVFRDQIFVFTPNGDVLQLPEDATPVDFAYAVHSDVGNHCTAAKINDRMVSLDTQLKSGDVCEILTEKNRKHANADWLDFVKTAGARAKIRQSIKKSDETSAPYIPR